MVSVSTPGDSRAFLRDSASDCARRGHCLLALHHLASFYLGCITGSLVNLGFHYFYFRGYLRDVITEVSSFIEIVASSFSRLSAFAASDSSMFLDELLFVQPRRRFILPRMNEESIRFVQLQVLLGCTCEIESSFVDSGGSMWKDDPGSRCQGFDMFRESADDLILFFRLFRKSREHFLKLVEHRGVGISVDHGDVRCRSLINVVADSGVVASLLILLIVCRHIDQVFCGCELD
ncbi:hypothetical protein F2Q70_00021692 [Brassica cretica]|uniref:Uncharacterized protein n=1 Tax=Brassica cretica TaxID=69181 RepID=A0A8S9GRM1_BRACR|nr:hypothetical protein F2Q70_00021692 [Brassica cretica]